MEQRSPEWFEARLGKVTASCIAKVMAKLKTGKPSADRENYAAQLMAERLTGMQQDSFSNAAMQWGTETEPQARAAYEFLHGVTVEEVGFVDHPIAGHVWRITWMAIVGRAFVEIKCPDHETHFETWKARRSLIKYIKQMQWQMVTGREMVRLASYDPRVPESINCTSRG